MKDKLYVTARGLTTSVGLDANTSCSSIRAGLNRLSPISGASILDLEIIEPVEVIGHPLDLLTLGYAFVGRWIRLITSAMEDLVANVCKVHADDLLNANTTAYIFALPVIDERFLQIDELNEAFFSSTIHSEFCSHYGIDQQDTIVRFVHDGHASVIKSVEIAAQLLDSHDSRIKNVMIIAVDSYIESLSLEFLQKNKRLFNKENNLAGLMPGEAAGILVLTNEQGVNKENKIIACIESYSTKESDSIYFESDNLNGLELSQSIEACLQQNSAILPFSGDVYLDLNGESWRSVIVSNAITRLSNNYLEMSQVNKCIPAVSIGDVGAASGVVSICLAMHSWWRAYALSEVSLICSISDYGHVGTLLLSNK